MGEPTDLPRNWTWSTAHSPRWDQCVVVDVDGVIADGSQRQHHLQGARRDWRGFFADAASDEPILGSVELLSCFTLDLAIVLLTARPHYLHQITLDWVTGHGYRWDLLIMRDQGDQHMSSVDFKRRSLCELSEFGLEPVLCLDDDQRNITMMRTAGLAAMYVHSGYYDH